MSAITTHVLDTARGCPAPGVSVVLQQRTASDEWQTLGNGDTDGDGRLRTLMPAGVALQPGTFRLLFETRRYFDRHGVRSFHPHIIVVFEVAAGDAHCHVPLLVSPFGYTTYRGS